MFSEWCYLHHGLNTRQVFSCGHGLDQFSQKQTDASNHFAMGHVFCKGSGSVLCWWIKPHLKRARLSWRVRLRIMWHSNEDNVFGPKSAYGPRSLFPLPLLCFHVFTLIGEISSHLWPQTEAHTRNACAFHHGENQTFWWNLSAALDSTPFIRAEEAGRKVLAAWETEF